MILRMNVKELILLIKLARTLHFIPKRKGEKKPKMLTEIPFNSSPKLLLQLPQIFK